LSDARHDRVSSGVPARTATRHPGALLMTQAKGDVCYGFEIFGRRHLTLPVRSGTGTPLTLSQTGEPPKVSGPPVLEIRSPEGVPFARIHRSGGALAAWISDAGWFEIDPVRRSISLPSGPDKALLEARLWAVPIAMCMLERGDLPLHAAAVDIGGSALVLAAPTFHGKTTLAAGFVRRGFRVLSEDVTCVSAGGVPSVLPGPAFLRLRRHTHMNLSIPGATVVAEEGAGGRVYVAMDGSQRGTGDPVPLAGILLIRPTAGGFRLEPVARADAMPDLWALALNQPTRDGFSECFLRLSRLIDLVPVWNLHRPSGLHLLDDVVERLANLFGGMSQEEPSVATPITA
ncbi:MAG: hypothetical protein ACRD1T_18150, partial [Acidimicrobiia bacterium]